MVDRAIHCVQFIGEIVLVNIITWNLCQRPFSGNQQMPRLSPRYYISVYSPKVQFSSITAKYDNPYDNTNEEPKAFYTTGAGVAPGKAGRA